MICTLYITAFGLLHSTWFGSLEMPCPRRLGSGNCFIDETLLYLHWKMSSDVMLSEPYSACCCWGADPFSSPDWTALADLHPVVLLPASRNFHHVRRMVRNLWKCNSWDGSTNLTQTSLHEKRGRMIRELDHPRDKAETSYTKTFAKQCS